MTKIRQYHPSDEESWVKCHLFSYYDSTYFDELVKVKPRYETPSIELVKIQNDEIVGFLDVELEIEPGQFCFDENNRSGMISVLGVLPQHRREGIATKLVERALNVMSNDHDVHRLEIWVREDPSMLSWLKKLEFQELYRFYQVVFTSDFFEKYNIELPFGINPVLLTGNVESEGFSEMIKSHPPERTFPIIIYEKRF